MNDIIVSEIAIIDPDDYEVKIRFELAGKKHFCILNLKTGAFVSDLVNVKDEVTNQVAHYLSHRAEEHFEEQGLPLPTDVKCTCKH